MAATTTTNTYQDGRAVWFTRLASASRAALACSIVAYTTLYGPATLRRLVAFPAFSYLTATLIVTNAALGDAVRGCCLVVFATIQTVCPAMFLFWFIGPAKFSLITTAVTVALASVVVVLPSSTHLLAKKIALGQIVIIYVVGFIGGAQTDPLMHPLHVAATTALGAAASLIATLLPFPRLASLQVKTKSKSVVENMTERLSLMVKAILAEDRTMAAASISRAHFLSSSATKLLHSIKLYQESKKWEKFPFKICKMGWLSNSEKLEDLEMALNGMELALSKIPSYPIQNNPQNYQTLKHDLNNLENQINLSLKQANTYFSPSDSLTFPEVNVDDDKTTIINTLKSIQIIPTNHQDLPHFFFIFCMKLLYKKTQIKIPTKFKEESKETEIKNSTNKEKNRTWVSSMNKQRVVPALKCAISLGISVILGLIYNKKNGFWGSLAVAVSIASNREPTFKVANIKVHGTMLGSVFGILSFVLFEKFLIGRLLCLLPWFIFTSFLQHSTMYGSAGGISAIVGALVVLGRTNYGSPKEFAFERMIETFIGIFISILVDIIFQPKRASKLVKIQFILSLQLLQKCINDSFSYESSTIMEKDLQGLRTQVIEVKQLIDEAEVEPNFLFLHPFHGDSHLKMFNSLSKMVGLLALNGEAMNNLKESLREDLWRKVGEKLEGDFEKYKEIMTSGFVTFYEDFRSSSLKFLKGNENKEDNCGDIETGEAQRIEVMDEIEKEKLINSFLQHLGEIVESKDGTSEEIILSLSAMAFCFNSLIKEMEEVGEAIRELIEWEKSFF
ncbi:uncharacterized protein LOC103497175 [Cucumis melo]|uniref:Uncharacterized protein LOC103497175 n=1 Tax=Cucumis melo TaxID=3656 RepID=A0A1S3C6Y7_CUCME|nr:uncharacterized protein LOC103497175 [Cucumis melo]